MDKKAWMSITGFGVSLSLALNMLLVGCSTSGGGSASHLVGSATPSQDVLHGTWSVTQHEESLQIAYGGGTSSPEYAALDLHSSYFRLNYGPASGWGTSLILLPVFWSKVSCQPLGLCQGAPITATWQVEGTDLVLFLTGTIGTIAPLHVSCVVRLSPPMQTALTAKIMTTVAGNTQLDHRSGEAFKPLMLSSMHVSSTQWDTQAAYADDHTISLPVSGWIVHPLIEAQHLGLKGGTSSWKTNAPTIEIILDRPMQVTGWVTQSNNPNDDNVGFWSASDTVLPAWSYEVIARSA